MSQLENEPEYISIDDLRSEIVMIRLQKAIIEDFNSRREKEKWDDNWEKGELDLKKPSLP